MHIKMCLSCAEEVLLTDVQVMVVVLDFGAVSAPVFTPR